MTKFQQALERGEPLVLLLDFETFEDAGALLARHHFSMNPYAETDRQYDDRLMEYRFQVRFLGDFAASGLTELSEGAVRLAGGEALSAFQNDVAQAARTTLEVHAVTPGLPSAEALPSGRFEVVRLREEDDGSLTVDLAALDSRLRDTRIAVDRYLGLHQALDAASSPTLVVADENVPNQGDRRLDPVDALIIGAWIRLDQAPAVPAILARRFNLLLPAHPDFALVLEFSILLSLHPRAFVRTGTGHDVSVVASDLSIPLRVWSFVEFHWSSDSQLLTCRLNGKGSAVTAEVPDLASAVAPLQVNAQSSIPGRIAEFRYATRSIETAILSRRGTRRLEPGEIVDYGPYFTFEGEHILDDQTVFDLSPSALHGKAAGSAFVFVASETGTPDMAGEAVPRVIGLATGLASQRVSGDGRARRFCQGLIRSFRKVTTADHRPLWLKLSQTVSGVLSPAALKRDAASHIDLSGYQRFQTVRVSSPSLTWTAVVSMATPDAVFFRHDADDADAFVITESWRIETADPGTWTGLTCHGDSSTGRVRVDSLGAPFENFFRNSRVGQKIVLPDPVLPSKTYTIASAPESPFAEVVVAEPVFEGPIQGSVTLLEYFDALADLDAGLIRLSEDVGDLFADVTAGADATPRGVIEHLLALGGASAALPELDAYATGFGFALSDETTVGEMLAAAARSLDGVLVTDLETGDFQFEALTAPASPAELDFPEVVHVERLDEVEPFGAVELRYRLKGTSSQADSVVVPPEGTTLRRDAPVLETLLQEAGAAAERAEAIFELRKDGQEVYAVDVPLRYFRPDLPFRSVRLSGAQRLADKTWRVIGLGLTAPGLCRLLLWRNLP